MLSKWSESPLSMCKEWEEEEEEEVEDRVLLDILLLLLLLLLESDEALLGAAVLLLLLLQAAEDESEDILLIYMYMCRILCEILFHNNMLLVNYRFSIPYRFQIIIMNKLT